MNNNKNTQNTNTTKILKFRKIFGDSSGMPAGFFFFHQQDAFLGKCHILVIRRDFSDS